MAKIPAIAQSIEDELGGNRKKLPSGCREGQEVGRLRSAEVV